MAVLINNNGMVGLRESYNAVNASFNNVAELISLTSLLDERLECTGVVSNIGNKMLFKYLKKGEFSIIDDTNGMGFFPPFDMIRVVFPLEEFANLKDELLSQSCIDNVVCECVGLIELITRGIESDVIYFEIER